MSTINQFIIKICKKIKDEGVFGFIKMSIDKTHISIRTFWRKTFLNKNHIYTLQKPVKDIELPYGLIIKKYSCVEELPVETIDALKNEMGSMVNNWLTEEFNKSATLWVGYINGEYVVRQWTRFGKDFDKWFIELNDEDYVFFASGTIPKWRGKGLMPRLGNYIMLERSYLNGDAYVDIKVWNKSAINARKKNGAKYVTTMKPYK